MKQWKKLAAVLLAVATVASGLYIVVPEGSTAKAASTDDAVFSIKMQAKEHKNEQDEVESVDLRLISSVDSLDYKNVGFEVYFKPDAENPTKNTPITFTTSTVLERISAVSTGVEYNYSPKVIDVDSKYFVTGTLMGISKANLSADFYVRAFYTSLDGNTVTYGVGRYFNVQDATSQSIINIPVKIAKEDLPQADADTKKIPVTVAGVETAATVESWVDGYAHLNVDVPAEATKAPEGVVKTANKEKLASASKVAVGDAGAIYRNLKSTYANNGADSTWYSVYDAEEYDKFVIVTDADLEGFKAQVNGGNTFASDSTQDTIYMVSDIAMNDEASVNWSTGAITMDSETGETLTINQWNAGIGYYNKNSSPKAFSGVFDGQGHTISGLYCKGPTTQQYGVGLFGYLSSAGTLRNFRLEKSYIDSNTVLAFTGSVAGVCEGTIQQVYSDATVRTRNSYAGGLVGYGAVTITESWYAGAFIVNATDEWSRLGGLVGHLLQGGRVENCLNSGTITQEGSKNLQFIGGLLGETNTTGTTLMNSLFTGTLNVSTTKTTIGLLVGKNTPANVTNTYAVQGNSVPTVAIASNIEYQGVVTNTSDMTGYGAMTATAATKVTLPEGQTAVEVKMDFYDSVNNPTGKWTMRNGKTPALRDFVTSDALYTPDTELVTDEDGYLLISSPEELYGFAKLVNEQAILDENAATTYVSAKVKLANSITLNDTSASTYEDTAAKYTWIPIGSYNNGAGVRFIGEFDGDGHTISGVYCNVATSLNHGVGFFGATGGNAIVQDFKLINSYFYCSPVIAGGNGNHDLGSVVGCAGGTIKQVYSDAIVHATTSLVGGLVGLQVEKLDLIESWFAGEVQAGGTGIAGLVGYGGADLTIENCLNSGRIKGTSTLGYLAGLLGDAWPSVVSISHTLSTGIVESNATSNVGTGIGVIRDGCTVTLNEVYAVENATHTVLIGKGTQTSASANFGQKDKADITGYNALNNLDSAFDPDNVWVERINDVPALARFTPTSARIFQNNQYVIGSGDDLYGFATAFNAGTIETNANAKLTADITLNEGQPNGGTPDNTTDDWSDATVAANLRPWTPIGSYDGGNGIRFAGTFDGAGHTISGLYCEVSEQKQGVGLFGATGAEAEITNLRLTNSYFNQSTAAFKLVGSIMGYGGGTFTKIYSDAIIDTQSAYSGGLIGGINGESSISECWYDGTLNILADITGVGGIVGRADKGATITNCLNSGTINGETYGTCVGGIIGMLYNAELQIVNSLNTGDVNVRGIATNSKVIGEVQGPLTLTNAFSTGTQSGNVYGRITGNGSLASGAVQGVITEAITSGNASTLLQGFDFDTVWTMDGDQPVLRF